MKLSRLPISRRQLGAFAAVGAGAVLLPAIAVRDASAAVVAAATPAGLWGDQGDGTYVNPVLPGDFSDWDCIRVGADYYGITSTFAYSPGVAILHSIDLVNWQIIGHAVDDLTRIGPALNWDQMNRYGKGVWAGAIRYHGGKFWVYFNTPDEGFFMTTATNPAGPWEPVTSVWRTTGWDDPCPFWDDDGQGYLVTSNYANNYNIHLFQLAADGKSLVTSSDTIIHQSKGSEANKLYKINGWYFHLYSEVRSEGRVVMMNRSTNLTGPYETKQLQHVNKSIDREPNQGGLVQTPGGAWYWVTHQGSSGYWEGRTLSVLPVTWVDNWPIIGAVGSDGIGSMVWGGTVPAGGPAGAPLDALPGVVTSDDFTGTKLKPQWEWYYQPRADKWSLTERAGYLRLRAFAPLVANNLMKVGNTLTQRALRTASGQVTVRLDLTGLTDGQHAGLCHYASTYSGLGIARSGGVKRITGNLNGTLTAGATITGTAVWIRSSWDVNGVSQFAYSVDGSAFTNAGVAYQLTWGGYRGDRIGIYTYNPNGTGYVDVDTFQYTVAPVRAYTVTNTGSGKLLDVRGRSTATGVPVIQYHSTGADNQRWTFQSTGDGYHTITCVHSGYLLDGSGTALVQAAPTGGTGQQWKVVPVSGGPSYTLVNRRTGTVADVAAPATSDGSAVVLAADSAAASQRWTCSLVIP